MRKKSKNQLIEELRGCFNKHGKVNRRIFNGDDDFSSGKTIYNYFGSFANGCEEAGVPHENKPQKKDKVEVVCEYCGEKKKVYPYRLKENKNKRFFCDNSCQGDWWSENLTGENNPLYLGGGDWSDKYGSKWHVIREKCLKRDSFECRVCGLTYDNHVEKYGRGLEVHHIEPRRKFYNDEERSIDEANTMDNLVTLCQEHHVKAENGIVEVSN